MKTKKQLRIELEKARNEIAHLKTDVARLEADRTALANELSEQITKPYSEDAFYYLLGRRVEIRQADDSKSLAAQAQSFCSPYQNLQANWNLI